MASFFEPDSYLLDPTSYDELPSSFLSFSSFADFRPSSPFNLSSWDYGNSKSTQPRQLDSKLIAPSLQKTKSETSNLSTTSSPSDPFEIIEAAFEPLTPGPGEIGIFHTPEAKSRVPSSSFSTLASTATASSSSDPTRQSSSHSYRSSSSSEYDDPLTPALTSRSSVESFASTSTIHPGIAHKVTTQPYSWDEASSSLGGSSHYSGPTFQQVHRTTSNPTLASTRPRVPRPIASMPALKEEDPTAATPSAWFDGTEQLADFVNTFDFANLNGSASQQSLSGLQEGASSLQGLDDVLVDDFDWVFGDYGLGMADIPPESTIFAAFQQQDNQQASTGTVEAKAPVATDGIADFSYVNDKGVSASSYTQTQPIPYQQPQQLQHGLLAHQQDQQWLPTPTVQEAVTFPTYNYSSIANLPSFTIDPMTIMAPNDMQSMDEPSRPSSAPGYNNAGEVSTGMLSVPPGQMMRSVSSDGLIPQRHAAPRDLFSYAPQQIPVGPPAPQPLYTTEPSPSYNTSFPRSMPLTPAHTRRASMTGLTVQIQPPSYSTYVPSPLPPTPQSATFGDVASFQQQQQQAHQFLQQPAGAVGMTRAGTQPLPQTRRMSGSEPSTSLPNKHKMPAHLVRAQAIVQAQEAHAEAERQAYRRKTAAARVPMSQASVMQPQVARPQQTIMGWEGPSAQTTNLPVLTTTPLVTIQPPQAVYHVQGGPSHRVHPPPDTRPASGIATASRPMAKLPTSPAKRKVSASPNKRSPAGKKRQAQPMQPGGFSWGETTFINFTADDAEKLLTGVAPSGSQGKRKREEEAAAAAVAQGGMVGTMQGVEMDRERSKRSRSGE